MRFRNKLAFMMAAAIIVAGIQASAASAHGGGSETAIVGDSYASGEGGAPYLQGSNTPTDQCHRSTTAPVVFAAYLENKTPKNVACSGAVTTNIAVAGQFGEPSQASQIAGAKRLIVMIGGNDFGPADPSGRPGGFGQLLGCFLQTDCDQTALPAAAVFSINTELGAKLDAAYSAIRAAAPRADVTVVLYPPLLPAVGKPVGPNCPQINTGEIVAGNTLQNALNNKITERARAHQFGVANPAPLFAQGDVCGNASLFYLPGPAVPQNAWYHPNFTGRAALGVAAVFAS